MQLKGRPLWNFSLQKISMHRLFIHRVEKFRSRTSIFFQQSKSRFVGNTAGVSELFNSKKNMEFFEFEYIKGFRSNSMLLYTKDEKQIYKKTNFYNNGTRYVCYSENCGTSVFVDENERCRRLKNSQSHNHPTQEILKDKMVISQNIKEACKNASSERCSARAIFDEECRKANNSAHLVKYTQMQRNLRRIKNRVPPQKPSSPEIVNDMLSEDPLVIKCEFTEYEVSEPSYQSTIIKPKKNMEFFNFEYINGFRSNSMLVYTKDEKQIYRKTNIYNKGRRYVCYIKSCRASVFIDEYEICKKLNDSQSHNHPTQEVLKDKMIISQNIKEACKSASLKRGSTREIFDEECRKANDSAHLLQFKKMRRNLFRLKNSVLPKNPLSPENLKNMLSEEPIVANCEFTKYAPSDPLYQDTIVESKKKRKFVEFEYIKGFRSNSMLVYTKDEKQIYRKKCYYKKGTRYVCYNKKCRKSVFIDKYDRCKKLNDLSSHNHPTQELLKDTMLIRQSIKEACKNASLERCSTRDIFDEECRKANNSANLIQFGKMRRNLCRIKNSVRPKNPSSPEKLKNMLSEEPFVTNTEYELGGPSDKGTITESKKNTEFLEFEYINGFRANSKLVYTKDEKQIYKKKYSYNKGTRYVCYNKNCCASVSIDQYERCKKLNDSHSHNHPTQELLKDKMTISKNIKEACNNASSERWSTRNIFEEECRKANNSANLIQFGKMRRNLCRIKNSVRPKNPSSPEKLKNMLSEEPFVTNTEYELGGPSDKGTITESKKNTEFFEFEYINGFRANSKLVYTKDEKQVYKKKYSYNKGTRYVCYNKNCCASVSIDQYERCKKLNDSHSHNHPTQELLKDKMTISKNIKEACKNASSERWSTRNIFEEECRKANISAQLVQFEKMRRNLSLIKNSALPKNPLSPEELKNMFSEEAIMAKYGFSKYDPGERFYQGTIIESEYSFAIFMSPTIKKLILENSHIRRSFYLDGTFGVAPSSTFEHLIIIHIEYLDHIFPFFYVMMTNKSQAAYIHMLQYINTNLIDLNPVSFMTDYEEDLRNALKSVFPLAELSGCWFHYCQAIRQSAREIPNFIVALRWNNALRRLMKKFMALPLLKPDMINTALGLLQAEVDKMPMTSTYSTISNDFIERDPKAFLSTMHL
ncbi:PREDICTED: uncharacterized protein LOC108365875 isoform X2 [Rhagoletis zephyria]|uniref:uncharacterized protein LOC108365875 isoform X2 n=1 Tax=Rhagoletis zephyria TaxID=28612 RepID=UPI0008113D52|nr:PREDICTED: uncharacterized protein LOC108365875 isoform X2 [Rhagoletis zephyria]